MKKLIAVLDGNRRLVGTKRKATPDKDDVVLPEGCDLSLDGMYKWDGASFVPLGHGFGPVVTKPPFSETAVLYELVDALGDDAPVQAREWADWYAVNLKVREEEMALRRRKPKMRR